MTTRQNRRTRQYSFQQIHIDVARNATDDFNPFHDSHRWQSIRANPYGGPIVLGFQLAALADHLIETQRRSEQPTGIGPSRYLHYDFRYAGALRPGEPFAVQVGPTISPRTGGPGALNRVIVRKQNGQAVLLGSRADKQEAANFEDRELGTQVAHRETMDRSYLANRRLFLKRKYLNTSNGKNFLLGSLVDQDFYFDELAERVQFPPMFTASLLSCALLERARADRYDFAAAPLVYVSHHITVDNTLQKALQSNDRLDMLVGVAVAASASKGLAQPSVTQQVRHCLGFIAERGLLFSAQLQLASLQAIVAR